MRVPISIAVIAAALALGSCKPGAPPTNEYAYPAWGFKASFPSAPTESSEPGSADGSTPASFLVESKGDTRHFAVWAADVSKDNLSLDDLANNAKEHVGTGLGATASIPTYAATSEGVIGREYAFTANGKWQQTMSVYLSGGRFYEVIAKSAYGQDDPAVKNFLFSFHALGGAPATNAPETNAAPANTPG